jgi:hypothetical protein
LAYACNKDDDRAAALRMRNVWMRDTLSDSNRIPEDGNPAKKMSEYLPDVMKDDAS